MVIILKTKDTKPIIIEIIAILVDFTPRPYAKFFKINGEIPEKKLESRELDERNPNAGGNNEPKNPERGPLVLLINEKAKANNSISFFSRQKKIMFLAIAGLFFVGYTTKDLVFPEKHCMQWQVDHYEKVDCEAEIDSLFANAPIEPIDEKAIDLRKIEVCDTFPFFCGDKAVVWYCKVGDEPEYFDGPGAGFHPITKKQLNPITDYIIDKYVKRR